MKKGVKISVIVPIYNVEKYIQECLISILEQNYDNLEIILVNDGTKDNSIKVIEKYLTDKRIKLVNKVNGGLSSARNMGMKVATGEYIHFIDSDDWIEKNLYSRIFDNIEGQEDIILFDRAHVLDRNIKFKNGKKIKKYLASGDVKVNFYKKIAWACWCKIYKKEFLDKYNFKFIEEIIHEDKIWEIETISKAKKIIYIPILGYYYRIKREGSITTSLNIELHKKSCKIIQKEIVKFLQNNSENLDRNFCFRIMLEYYTLELENKKTNLKTYKLKRQYLKYLLNHKIDFITKQEVTIEYIKLYLKTCLIDEDKSLKKIIVKKIYEIYIYIKTLNLK